MAVLWLGKEGEKKGNERGGCLGIRQPGCSKAVVCLIDALCWPLWKDDLRSRGKKKQRLNKYLSD